MPEAFEVLYMFKFISSSCQREGADTLVEPASWPGSEAVSLTQTPRGVSLAKGAAGIKAGDSHRRQRGELLETVTRGGPGTRAAEATGRVWGLCTLLCVCALGG